MGIIESLTKAILTRYNSAEGINLRNVLTSGLFFQRAPDDTAVPYAVFSWQGTDIDDTMGGRKDRIEKVDLQFNIYADSSDAGQALMNIEKQMQILFDWCNLDYPQGCDYRHIAFQRTSIMPIIMYDKYMQLTLVYTAWVDH